MRIPTRPILPLMLLLTLCLCATAAFANIDPAVEQDAAIASGSSDELVATGDDWGFPGQAGVPPHKDDWGGPIPGETNWGWGQHPEGPTDSADLLLPAPLILVIF